MAFAVVEAKEFNKIWNKKGELKVGDSIEGYLIEVKNVTTKVGDSTFYEFETEEKEGFTVAGSADIKRKLTGIETGSYLRITYTGMVESQKGNPMREYKIEIDDARKR